MSDSTYKLEELARAAGISPRTVRYYVQRGLVPAPRFRGKDTSYDREHLVRLRAIRKMQEAFFPLDAIAVELERRSLESIARIADGRELPVVVPGVAPPAPNEPVAHEPPEPLDTARALRKLELAEGVELLVAEDAPPESRRLVERILRTLKVGKT